MVTAKSYCFTAYVEPDIKRHLVHFAFWGKELCPTTQRMHWQGFFQGKENKIGRKAAQHIIGVENCNVRPMEGGYLDNILYCNKEKYNGEMFEYGVWKGAGYRTDLDELKDEMINGRKVGDIIMKDPMKFHQYGRTLDRLEDEIFLNVERKETTLCEWIYGPTGSGKSHKALTETQGKSRMIWTNDGGWWDQYRQQEYVIINDFRGEIDYAFLLQLIDKWPVNVRRRGRSPMPFTSKKIYITSPLSPQDCYATFGMDNIDQLLRRITITKLERRGEGGQG